MTLGLSASGVAFKDSSAPLTKQQVKALIKTAKTPEDHQKLARYYWYEANKLKSEAKDHQDMEADYEQNPSVGHPIPKWPTLGQHCKDLSAYYQKAAEQAEQLAKAHEKWLKVLLRERPNRHLPVSFARSEEATWFECRSE